MKSDSVKIFYPGSCISVNHRLGKRKDGGYYVKPEAREWETEYQWLLKRVHLEEYKLPIHVTVSAYFKNERSACDLVNFQKSVLDPIEDLTGINDKDFRWHDGERVVGVKEPYLLITFRESEE